MGKAVQGIPLGQYLLWMHTAIVRSLLVGLVSGSVVLGAPIANAASFDLGKGSDTGMSGVSPFAMPIDANTDRVFHSAGEAGGWLMSTCVVSGTCTDTPLPPDFGTDYTQVTLADGSLRAYFVLPEPDGTKEIATATVTYSDGIPLLGPTNRLGITAAPGQRAWGVPDSVVMPDGRVRLYWVDEGQSRGFEPTRAQQQCLIKALGRKGAQGLATGKRVTKKAKKAARRCGIPVSAIGSRGSRSNEVIKSATSTDLTGTAFTPDPGFRTTGGYVDSDVIRAEDGDWVMLLSTGPGDPPQRLFAATSPDGLEWKIDAEPLTPRSINVLDPTAIAVGANKWRVYYSQSPKGTPFANHRIFVSTLTR